MQLNREESPANLRNFEPTRLQYEQNPGFPSRKLPVPDFSRKEPKLVVEEYFSVSFNFQNYNIHGAGHQDPERPAENIEEEDPPQFFKENQLSIPQPRSQNQNSSLGRQSGRAQIPMLPDENGVYPTASPFHDKDAFTKKGPALAQVDTVEAHPEEKCENAIQTHQEELLNEEEENEEADMTLQPVVGRFEPGPGHYLALAKELKAYYAQEYSAFFKQLWSDAYTWERQPTKGLLRASFPLLLTNFVTVNLKSLMISFDSEEDAILEPDQRNLQEKERIKEVAFALGCLIKPEELVHCLSDSFQAQKYQSSPELTRMLEVLDLKEEPPTSVLFGDQSQAKKKPTQRQQRSRRESPVTTTFFGILEGKTEREKQTLALRPKVNLTIEDLHSEEQFLRSCGKSYVMSYLLIHYVSATKLSRFHKPKFEKYGGASTMCDLVERVLNFQKAKSDVYLHMALKRKGIKIGLKEEGGIKLEPA